MPKPLKYTCVIGRCRDQTPALRRVFYVKGPELGNILGESPLVSRPKAGVVLGTLGVGRPSLLAEIKTYIFTLCTEYLELKSWRAKFLAEIKTCSVTLLTRIVLLREVAP